jgi:hypothetical protein
VQGFSAPTEPNLETVKTCNLEGETGAELAVWCLLRASCYVGDRRLSSDIARLPRCAKLGSRQVARLLGERGEKRLRFHNLGKLRRRHEAFERRGEHGVGRTSGRLVKLCQRQRGTQSHWEPTAA